MRAPSTPPSSNSSRPRHSPDPGRVGRSRIDEHRDKRTVPAWTQVQWSVMAVPGGVPVSYPVQAVVRRLRLRCRSCCRAH